MDPDNNNTIAAPALKLATAWAAVGITSWADFASFLAALYTLALIGEWCWKNFARDLLAKWRAPK